MHTRGDEPLDAAFLQRFDSREDRPARQDLVIEHDRGLVLPDISDHAPY